MEAYINFPRQPTSLSLGFSYLECAQMVKKRETKIAHSQLQLVLDWVGITIQSEHLDEC
jgi:hypothetical protein